MISLKSWITLASPLCNPAQDCSQESPKNYLGLDAILLHEFLLPLQTPNRVGRILPGEELFRFRRRIQHVLGW